MHANLIIIHGLTYELVILEGGEQLISTLWTYCCFWDVQCFFIFAGRIMGGSWVVERGRNCL